MNRIIYLICFLGLLFVSCDNELNDVSDNDPKSEEIKLYAQKHIESKTKGVGLKDNLWTNGQAIKIKFLNGTTTQHDQVKRLSAEWLDYANLSFDFVEMSEQADVKIAFDWQGDGVTWSQVGKDATYVPQSQPSLNFGKLSKIDKLAKRDILMQFGHVLGLVNEHQSEGSPIEFDTEVLYEYYAAEGWTVKEVTDFFLIPFSDAATIREEYDSKSIMCWPIDEVVTLNGFGQARNSELSEGDKVFIEKLYSKEDEDIEIASISGSISVNNFNYPQEFSVRINSEIMVDWGDGTIQKYEPPINGYNLDFLYTKIKHSYSHNYYIEKERICTIKIFGSKSAITHINTDWQSIQSIDVSNSVQLKFLDMYCSSISEIDVSKNIELEHLAFYGRSMKLLDITHNPKLKVLSVPSSIFEINMLENNILETINLPWGIVTINYF